MELRLEPNQDRTGFHAPSEHALNLMRDWLKSYDAFVVTPIVPESKRARGYLHGAVEPAWAKWQYGIDPQEPGKAQIRHYLFMRDFNNEIITNRIGDPVRVPQSSKGKVRSLLNLYTRYAEENGAPIPNPQLYKTYRDQYSMDPRFPNFHAWLDFLGIEEDAMPSAETLAVLDEAPQSTPYPDSYEPPKF